MQMNVHVTARKFRQAVSPTMEVDMPDEEDEVLGGSKDEDEKKIVAHWATTWQSQH